MPTVPQVNEPSWKLPTFFPFTMKVKFFEGIGVFRSLPLMIFSAKGMMPEQRPGRGRATLAIVVLIETILAALRVDDLKAVEGSHSFAAHRFLGEAQNLAEGVIDRGIIPLDLIHSQ